MKEVSHKRSHDFVFIKHSERADPKAEDRMLITLNCVRVEREECWSNFVDPGSGISFGRVIEML